MKKAFFIIAALAALYATPAFAGGNNHHQNNQNQTQTRTQRTAVAESISGMELVGGTSATLIGYAESGNFAYTEGGASASACGCANAQTSTYRIGETGGYSQALGFASAGEVRSIGANDYAFAESNSRTRSTNRGRRGH